MRDTGTCLAFSSLVAAVVLQPQEVTHMASARPTVDHEEIRRWAEMRDGKPSCVKGTGGRGDVGMLRIDFPGYSGADSLDAISWDEWFRQFDENNLALLIQDRTAEGELSNFNKLVSRDTIEEGGKARGAGSGR